MKRARSSRARASRRSTGAGRPTLVILAASLLLASCGAADGGEDLAAELENARARAEAAETRVDQLEQQVTELAGRMSDADSAASDPTTEPTPGSTPTEPGPTAEAPSPSGPDPQEGTASLTGTVTDLPAGEPGKLDLILGGGSAGINRVPWVVRNNTDETVTEIEVTVTVRDGTGALFSSGSTHAVAPFTVAPGEIAIGYSYIGRDTPPADATYEFHVSHNTAGSTREVDIPVTEFSVREGQATGLIENTSTQRLRFVSAVFVCFDNDGALTFGDDTYANNSDLDAGAVSPFSARLSRVTCTDYLTGASGRPER